MLSHEGDPTVPCPEEGCNKLFYTKSMAGLHFKACHTVKENDFLCTYSNCPKAFDKRAQLSIHIKLKHLKVRDFICSYCKRGK